MTFISELPLLNTFIENRRIRLERLLQIASQDFNLHFEFGTKDVLGKSQIIMKVDIKRISQTSIDFLKGKALHLLGHYIYNSRSQHESAYIEEMKQKPIFVSLWHALEDARIENLMIRRWVGAHKLFEGTMLPNLGGSLLRVISNNEQIAHGIYYEGRGYYGGKYNPKIRLALDNVREILHMAANSSSPETGFLAMVRMYPFFAHLIFKGMRDQSKSENQEEVEQKELEKVQNDKIKNLSNNLKNQLPEILTRDDELVSVGVIEKPEDFPEWYKPGSMPWFEQSNAEKLIHPSVVQTARDTEITPPQGDLDTYHNLVFEVQREVGYLTQRLTNVIHESVYLRFGGYYRSGKLNMAKLWKQRTGKYRIFQRPLSRGRRAVAFTLLIDESASMQGYEKFKIAQKATILIAETLGLLCIPLEIIGYSTNEFEARAAMKLGLVPAYVYRNMRCSHLEHRIYKRFDEPCYQTRARLVGIKPRHNNWDEEHLLFALQRIQSRPELKKVIIVISDGQPNGNANHLIQTIRRAESLGVMIIGIGIGENYVKQIYPKAVVVEDMRQLVDELLHILLRIFYVEVE